MSTTPPNEPNPPSKREPVICAWPGCGRAGFLCSRDLNRVNTMVREGLVSKTAPATWPEAWERRRANLSGHSLISISASTREELEQLGFEWGTAGGPVHWLLAKAKEAEGAAADLAEIREWAQSGPDGRPPYRPNNAGMLQRLDESFAMLREVENELRDQVGAAGTSLQAMRARILAALGEPSLDELAASDMEPLTDEELLSQLEHVVRNARRRRPDDLDETAAQVIRWQVAFLRSTAAELEESWGYQARQVVTGLRSIADTLACLVEVRRVSVAPGAVGVAHG
jgi:hypothetical protein